MFCNRRHHWSLLLRGLMVGVDLQISSDQLNASAVFSCLTWFHPSMVVP
jgi:hypothetical protein